MEQFDFNNTERESWPKVQAVYLNNDELIVEVKGYKARYVMLAQDVFTAAGVPQYMIYTYEDLIHTYRHSGGMRRLEKLIYDKIEAGKPVCITDHQYKGGGDFITGIISMCESRAV